MHVELQPLLIGGTIKEITDVGVRIDIKGRMGVLSLPLRWVYTDRPLALGQEVEFYFSPIHVLDAPTAATPLARPAVTPVFSGKEGSMP